METKHIVIFSHGFGVEKDDRGLFTAIAAQLQPQGIECVLFDYTHTDRAAGTRTQRSFSEQVAMLQDVYQTQRQKHPEAVIDLVCHSQGGTVAALAQLEGVRKTLFLAVPTNLDPERTIKRYREKPGVVVDLEGISSLPGSDGITKLIPAAYWQERQVLPDLVDLYNQLGQQTELVVVVAGQDKTLGETHWDRLSAGTQLLEVDGDHEFSEEDREGVVEVVKKFLV